MANQKYDAFLTVARLGSFKAAAEELGISKTTLWRKMKRYGLPGRYQ